jgi:hypothetical protein
MLGLTDRHIAHDGAIEDPAPAGHKRYDADYVLANRPAFIVMNLLPENGQSLASDRVVVDPIASNEALLNSPEFWQGYTRVRIRDLPSHEVVFVRNDRAHSLIAAGLVTPVLTGY